MAYRCVSTLWKRIVERGSTASKNPVQPKPVMLNNEDDDATGPDTLFTLGRH